MKEKVAYFQFTIWHRKVSIEPVFAKLVFVQTLWKNGWKVRKVGFTKLIIQGNYLYRKKIILLQKQNENHDNRMERRCVHVKLLSFGTVFIRNGMPHISIHEFMYKKNMHTVKYDNKTRDVFN